MKNIAVNKMKTCRFFVDRKLLPVKVHYFLFFAALACALPYRTIYAKQLGISATAVGAIFSAIPLLRIILNPLCGFILDYFKRFRLTISAMMIIVALSHIAMVTIPLSLTTLETNNSEILKNQFHSNLGYSCTRDMLSNEIEHNIEILSNHNDLNTEEREISFSCVMECSNLTNNVLPKDTKKVNFCIEHMKIEYMTSVFISDNNMKVYVSNVKLLNIEEDAEIFFISRINASSIIHNKLSVMFNGNECSKDSHMLAPLITLSGNLNDSTDNFNIESEFGEKVARQKLNSHNEELLNFSNGSRKSCALYNYQIKSDGTEWFETCPCSLEFGCIAKKCFPNNLEEDYINEIQSESIAEKEETLSMQFWVLLITITLSSQSFSAIIFMTDTICYELLQEERSNYGQQRLWGTIGWGIGVLVGGYVNQIVSSNSEEIDYAPSFYLLAVITMLDLIPVYQFKVTDVKFSSQIWKDVCFLLSKSSILYNVVMVYFIGVLSGLIWNYQFWFMEELGASQVLLGLSQTFDCIFEIPFFLASGWIISKIGFANCNSLTFLCFGLRYLCYVFMYDPWLTLPAAFFQGPTFGLFYASMTMYAKQEAPQGTEATVQSLLHLCFEGIGAATGIVLGGVAVDHFGSRATFLYAMEISFILFFVSVAISLITYMSKRKLKEAKDIEEKEMKEC